MTAMGGDAAQAWSREAQALWAALREDAPLPAEALASLLAGLRDAPPAAVWHPTGFVVLTLLRRLEGALRLHLWPQGERVLGTPCWPVHDHAWHLRSHVLCGRLESVEYEVVDDDDGAAALYAVDYGPGRSSCMRKSERRVRVSERAPRTIEAGQRYEVSAGVFHASSVAEVEFTTTLAATRPTEQRWPWVVGELEGPTVVSVERPSVAATRTRELLQRIRTALGHIGNG